MACRIHVHACTVSMLGSFSNSKTCIVCLKGWYSRTSIIRPSIIRNLDYPAWQFYFYNSENGRVPQMRMRVTAVTMETCLLIFCACADNHVALLIINKVGGSRRGLSIRLSGIFTYPACFWNQGVRIIEVLL